MMDGVLESHLGSDPDSCALHQNPAFEVAFALT